MVTGEGESLSVSTQVRHCHVISFVPYVMTLLERMRSCKAQARLYRGSSNIEPLVTGTKVGGVERYTRFEGADGSWGIEAFWPLRLTTWPFSRTMTRSSDRLSWKMPPSTSLALAAAIVTDAFPYISPIIPD